MRPTFIALITSAILMLMLFTAQAEDEVALNYDSLQYTGLQSHMFDGIKLSESQRQQMRDLMQQVQQGSPLVGIDDVENLHRLVIAEQFDENAVRDLIEIMSKRQVERQVDMAKVRHRMYHMLNADQQAELEKNYQWRITQLQRTER